MTYSNLMQERRTLREANSLLNRIAVHLDEKTRETIKPLRIKVWNELCDVINALY